MPSYATAMIIWVIALFLIVAILIGIAIAIDKLWTQHYINKAENFNKTHPEFIKYNKYVGSFNREHIYPLQEEREKLENIINDNLQKLKYYPKNSETYKTIQDTIQQARTAYVFNEDVYNSFYSKIVRYKLEHIPKVLQELDPKDWRYIQLKNELVETEERIKKCKEVKHK